MPGTYSDSSRVPLISEFDDLSDFGAWSEFFDWSYPSTKRYWEDSNDKTQSNWSKNRKYGWDEKSTKDYIHWTEDPQLLPNDLQID